MLIALQNPKARYLKTFVGWKNAGYVVRKGEKSIAILAPITYKVKDSNDEETKLRGFKGMAVFDISQVELVDEELAKKANIPKYIEYPTVKGDEASELYTKTKQIFLKEYTIREKISSDGSKGSCNPITKIINIDKNLPYNHKFKTLIHELSHMLFYENGSDNNLSRKEMEIKAETTAFIVCSHFNIDTVDYSSEYIASYSATSEDALDSFLKHHKDIYDISTKIINKIEAE